MTMLHHHCISYSPRCSLPARQRPRPPVSVSPGHAAVVTHPAVLLLVVAAAGLAGEHVAVQTLTLTVDQKLEGLQAADAERVRQLTLRAQQLSLRTLLLDFSLQITAQTRKDGENGGMLP